MSGGGSVAVLSDGVRGPRLFVFVGCSHCSHWGRGGIWEVARVSAVAGWKKRCLDVLLLGGLVALHP